MSEFLEHKLIPVSKFKKMAQDCNIKKEPEQKRSISQIISKYNENEETKAGEGFKQKGPNLYWTLNDETKLPQYSVQTKIDNSFNEYEQILNSNIPEHLKITLMQYYRQKYNNSKLTSLNEDMKDVDIADEIEKVGMETTILKFPTQGKRTLARNILIKLSQMKDFITWDKLGDITNPAIHLDSIKNLKDFISILIFAKHGTSDEIMNVYQIIEPFYSEIASYIVNTRIKKLYTKNNKGSGSMKKSGNVKYMIVH